MNITNKQTIHKTETGNELRKQKYIFQQQQKQNCA